MSKYVRPTSAATLTCTSSSECCVASARALAPLTLRLTRPKMSSSHDASKPTSQRFCAGSCDRAPGVWTIDCWVRKVVPVPVTVGRRSSDASLCTARAPVKRASAMRTSMLARCASRTSEIRVVSAMASHSGVDASAVLTWTFSETGAPATCAGEVTVVGVGTEYVSGTGTSDARYAGVPHAASTPVNPTNILRMGAALISCHQRRTPRTERFDVVRSLNRLAGNRHRGLGAAVYVSAHQHIEERREQQTEECHAEHSGKHRDSHHPTHFRAGAARNDERDNPGDERERRHEDRTQSDSGRLEGSRKPVASLALQ